MKINIASNEIIHFIGIGGIGMSGLAQIMFNMGFQVQGSDLSNSKNTDRWFHLTYFVPPLHSPIVEIVTIFCQNQSPIDKNGETRSSFQHFYMKSPIVSSRSNSVIET